MARFEAKLQVKGLAELDHALKRLPDVVEERIIRQGLEVAGEVVRSAAVANINSRTGKTAADIRMEVQHERPDQWVAGVGGTRRGTVGRAHILRWLEFGTRPHKVIAGAPGRRGARRAIRALRSNPRLAGLSQTAVSLRGGIRGGSIVFKRALKLPGGVFRASAQSPGTRSQSPLTRALFEQGDRALKVFGETVWDRIKKTVPTIRAGG